MKGISTRAAAVIVVGIVIVVGLVVGSSGVLNSTGTTRSSTSSSLSSIAASSVIPTTPSSSSSVASSISTGANVTVGTGNSTLGLELLLSVNSTTIPSEDAIDVSARVMNTRLTANNLTAVGDWPMGGLTSGPCSGGWYPLGVAFFRGYYSAGNITNGEAIDVWPAIGCPAQGPINVTSFSFLPNDDIVNYSGYFPGAFPNATKGESSTFTHFGEPVFAANGTGFYNSLDSALPSNYTLVAGDEWGQIVMLHFEVTPSNLIPKVGNFVFPGGCSPGPCIGQRLSGALVFNCAEAAATPTGCAATYSEGVRYSAAPPVNYTVTVWYPSYNQPGEPASANCMYNVIPVGALVKPETPTLFGYCLLVNSTSFVVNLPDL